MARNKHPEETVNRILEAATRLFIEKGYEHTSIQDIISNLGGLSKGAIYHHFKSKEDILEAVTDKMTEESNKILDREDLTGKEKMKMIFKESVGRSDMDDLFAVGPDLSNNPRLLFSTFRDTVDNVAPFYIRPIIEQGIADGTIQTDYPAALSELVTLAANIWINPMVFNNTMEEYCRKLMVFKQMMEGFGLDIVDDELIERMRELAAVYLETKNKQ